jgi:hypothetical protein
MVGCRNYTEADANRHLRCSPVAYHYDLQVDMILDGFPIFPGCSESLSVALSIINRSIFKLPLVCKYIQSTKMLYQFLPRKPNLQLNGLLFVCDHLCSQKQVADRDILNEIVTSYPSIIS